MSNIGYTSFLLKTAFFEGKEELIAAILPCYWIYLRVAKEMKVKSGPNNPYEDWISMYSSQSYAKNVAYMINLADRFYDGANKEKQEAMLNAFLVSASWELAFWEDSYRMKTVY